MTLEGNFKTKISLLVLYANFCELAIWLYLLPVGLNVVGLAANCKRSESSILSNRNFREFFLWRGEPNTSWAYHLIKNRDLSVVAWGSYFHVVCNNVVYCDV